MALLKRLFAGPVARLAQRFGGKDARFRLAIVAGFAVATVAFTTVVIDDRSGIADSFFGEGGIFSGVGFEQQQQPPEAAAPSQTYGWLSSRRHVARRSLARRVTVAKVQPARFLRSVEHAHSVRFSDTPMELGRQSVCVRLCDGFAFPVGAYHGEQDRASHEATCQSECPGAATALYVQPAGTDTMDDAIRVGTSKSYSDLPYAFHYTTVLSDACTCHPPQGNRIKSLLHDFTLRRGDAVMTATGFKVFHGGARFPYRRDDFLALARSPDVKRGDRDEIHAIERASLNMAPNVIAERAPATAAPVARATTQQLEHQASLTVTPAAP